MNKSTFPIGNPDFLGDSGDQRVAQYAVLMGKSAPQPEVDNYSVRISACEKGKQAAGYSYYFPSVISVISGYAGEMQGSSGAGASILQYIYNSQQQQLQQQ